MQDINSTLKFYEETEKFACFSDITDIIKEIMGDFVKSAEIFLGYIYKEDTEYEQERDKNLFKDVITRIINSFETERRITINSDQIVKIKFENGNIVELSSMDYAFLRKMH